MAKKTLLKNSLEELENIRTESLELAKQQLINENAEKLEQATSKIFEELIESEDEKNDDDSDKQLDEDSDENFIEVDINDENCETNIDESVNNKLIKENEKMESNKDLRKATFKKLLEAYQNMDENDSFVIDSENDDLQLDEAWIEEEMTEMRINKMLDEMDIENDYENQNHPLDVEIDNDMSIDGLDNMSGSLDTKFSNDKNPQFNNRNEFGGVEDWSGLGENTEDIDSILEKMNIDELQEVYNMLDEEDGGDSSETQQDGQGGHIGNGKFAVEAGHDFLNENEELDSITENDITEALESLDETKEIEEGHSIVDQTRKNVGGSGVGKVEGRPERRSNIDEEISKLKEENTKLMSELTALKEAKTKIEEGFNSKLKQLQDKIYDVSITAIKAGYANRLMLEHSMTDVEKVNVIHKFAQATNEEQIISTFKGFLNEFVNKRITEDGSILNESIQNKMKKVHKTDKAVLTETTLIDKDEDRYNKLVNFNYKYGKK